MSVLTPNFTESPGLITSLDVKIITPCGVFSPTHPFSVLNDLKVVSAPNQTLNVLTSSFELFVNLIIVVSSKAILVTSTSSANTFSGIVINIAIDEINTIERKIPLIEDFVIFINLFISHLNLKEFFPFCYLLIQYFS